MTEEPLTKAKYIEWEASIFGACGIALGLGALLAGYIRNLAWVFIILGILFHGWGMLKIHKRNK